MRSKSRLFAGLVSIAFVSGCSVDRTPPETTLIPLVTTTTEAPQFQTLPSEVISYTPTEFAFFDDVAYYYGASPELGDDEMLELGNLWCELMVEGMNDTDVVERINEGGTDNADRRLHFSIVLSGISNLCPDQQAKAEYIALNSPLP